MLSGVSYSGVWLTMTNFMLDAYRNQWEEIMVKLKKGAAMMPRTRTAEEVGTSDEYDGERMDCRDWTLDEGFVTERIYEDDLNDAEAAESYLMDIIREGPKCHHCLYNDGGPKSCVQMECVTS